jgi:hypothetical protein
MKQQSANNQNKAIIFDSGTIINFTMNGLLEEFKELKKIFNGKFLITKDVLYEIVEKPLEIKRFKLEALKIKELIAEGILESPKAFGIDESKISKNAEEIRNKANNIFFDRKGAIHIIDLGEASCLALSRLLNEKGIRNVISVDERTIRILGEKPENLLTLLQKKLHANISARRENFKYFEGFKFIRSVELIFIAYKRGIIKLKNHNVLDALLYALKFNGCSVSDEEIAEMEKLG